MANVSFKDALKKVTKYFNRDGTGAFWRTPIADKLTKAQQFVERVPERPIKFQQVAQGQSAPVRFVANLPQTIVSETLNLPNRTIYNARQIGEGIRDRNRNQLIRGAAGAGEALIDIATLGFGSSVAKKGIQEAGEQTFKETLKRLKAAPFKTLIEGVKGSQGLRLGAGQGSLIGVQSAIDRNPQASIQDILKSAAASGTIGAGVGLVAEPTLRYGSEAVGKGVKAYRNSVLSDQKGAIDSDLLSGGMKRILSGKSKVFSEEPVQKEFGRTVGPQVAEAYLKNPDPSNVKALQDTFKTLSRTTMYKSFDDDKALKAIAYYVDTIGGDAISQVQKKVFGNKIMKPELVKSFWKELKNEAVARTGKSYKQLEQEADDSLLGMVDDVVDTTSKVKVDKTMKSILTPTMRNEADDIYTSARSILEALPKRADVDDKTAQIAFEGALGSMKQAFKEIEQRAMRVISKDDFVDMIEGKKSVDPRVSDLVDLHKNLTDDLIQATENPNIGRIKNYYPHSTDQTTRIMDELFPNVWIDRLNTLGGHFMKRTGTLKDYDKNYSKVMGDYVEQALYEKYRPVFKGSTPVIEEIVEHVKKAGDDTIDYIEKLKPEKLKGEIGYVTRTNVSKSPLRTYNDIFSKIGKEAPDVFDAFRKVRDNNVFQQQWSEQLAKIFDPSKPRKAYEYLATDVLGLTGKDADAFMSSAIRSGQAIGPDRFIAQVLRQTKKMSIQDFIEETAKYSYKENGTKDIVNYYIDGLMKKEALEPAVLDWMANGMSRVFSMAHLGLNLKTGVVQALEINRIPATYGPANFAEGLRRSVTDANRLTKTYGFGDMKHHYLVDDYYSKVEPTLPKEIAEKVQNGLMKHIQIMENWKNKVYMGAAEAQGEAMGLTGKELFNHVRDSVYKYAHVSDEFNTPGILMSKEKLGKGFSDGQGLISTGAASRLLLQYGQFAIKNAFGKIDTLQEKELGKLAGLLLADVLNIAITMTAFSMGKNALQNAVGQIAPTSLGPITQLPFQLAAAIQDYNEAKEQGYSGDRESQALKKLLIGSFVPAGTQINKTMGQVDTMLKGFKPTSGGNVAYPESGSALENLYGLLFGSSSTPSGKEYVKQGLPYLRENQSEVYKMLYENNPQSAREYYSTTVENRKQKGNKVEDILKGNIKNTAIKTADDGSLILPTPSGNMYNVEQLLAEDAAKDAKNTTITQILNRKDQYEALPQGDTFTQLALQQEGVTDEDYRKWKMQRVNSQLTGKEKAQAFMQMVTAKETTFTELFKEGILTKGEIDDLERYGFINDAEGLYEKLKMTDSFYIKKELNKIKKDTMEKLLKQQAKVSKQLVNESAKRQVNLLRQATKVKTRKRKTLPPIKLPSLTSGISTKITTRRYAPERQRRITT